MTLSTDPRHSFSDNPGAAIMAGPFSQWPETLGLAAIGDEQLVEQFADIARQEYTAVGLRVALHPQVDLATEPRWARQVATFGEDADLSGRLGAAYIRGFQGVVVRRGLGLDDDQALPGRRRRRRTARTRTSRTAASRSTPAAVRALHLKPFEAAFEAGTRQVMPYYGMPVGTEYEEVGFGFNKSVITGLLRERYGFDGVVCTDWGLVNDAEIFGQPSAARAWGVEHLSPRERMKKILDAGADQFGGEACPELLVELVDDGEITEERLDASARRILREKFELGLFENPFVDEDAADEIVGRADFRAAGEAAQRAAITVLTNRPVRSGWADEGTPALPLARGIKLYVEGIDADIAAQYGEIVATPEEADAAILRLQAPYEERATMFENFFHAGSLAFAETSSRT